MNEYITKPLFVFSVVFALDFIWTRYISAIAAKQPTASAIWSAGVILLSGVAAVEYVANPWLLLPAGLGAFTATWIAVHRERNRDVGL